MRVVPFLLTLLPVGCMIPKGTWGDDDERSDPADPDDDTGSEDDTGSDEEEPPCPSYSGLDRLGTTWSYETTPAWEDSTGYVGAAVEEVTAFTVTEDGAEVVVSYEVDAEYAGGEDSLETGERTYRCDEEGVWLVRVESDNAYTWGGYRYETHTLDVIDGWLVLPRGLAEGDAWASEWTVENYIDGEFSATTEHADAWEATGASLREVPGGAFEVLEVTRTEGGAERRYLHAGAGLVEDDELRLVAWAAP